MREWTTPENIAAEIRMTRKKRKTHTFLLLEGETDSRLYEKFVDGERCEMISTHGKEKALASLAILENENFPGVLAIVDADFDRLEGKSSASPNLLFTDTHDLETMMLKSSAFGYFLDQHRSKEKMEGLLRKAGKEDIREILLETALPIGYSLWLSLRENLGCDFDKLSFDNFINKNTLRLKRTDFFNAFTGSIQNNNRYTKKIRQPMLSEEEFFSRVEQLSDSAHDPWHVCRGHDLIQILSLGLHKAIGTRQSPTVTPEELETKLRLAFAYSHFRETQHYLDIRKWQDANAPFLVLRVEE